MTSAPDAVDPSRPDPVTEREAGLAAAFAEAFRLGPQAPPAETNEDDAPLDAAPEPPAKSDLEALLEPDSDVEAEGAAPADAAADQAGLDQAGEEPTADDTESGPVVVETQALAAEAARPPGPESEPSAEPEASVASEAEVTPEPDAPSEADAAASEVTPSLEPEPALAAEVAPEPAAVPEPDAPPEADAAAPEVTPMDAAPGAEASPEADAAAPEITPSLAAEVTTEADAEPEPPAPVSTTEAEPASAPPPEPQAEAAPTTDATARKRPSRRVLVAGGIAALAAAVTIGAVIGVTSGSSQHKPQSSSPRAAAPTAPSRAPSAPSTGSIRPAVPIEPATIVSARAWLSANIPRSQLISADPNLVSELRSAGFAAAHAEPGYPDAPDWRADRVIISTPQTRARAASVPALMAELAASIPVAVFGTGTQSVEARMVFGTASPDVLSVQAQRQDDATNRRLAGEDLLRNPRVTIAPAWSTLVATGGLDLRASVVIGLIAARTEVSVVAVKIDPAENAAGVPARTVRLSIPPSVLPGVLSTLPAGYRPDRIASPTQDNTQLTELSWGVTLTPQPTLS